MQTDEEAEGMPDFDVTVNMPEATWRRHVVGMFAEHRKLLDDNTSMTKQVLEQTAEIRSAVTHSKWLGRAIATIVKWSLMAVRKVANYLAPIVAVAVAILAYLGITWKGPPPP